MDNEHKQKVEEQFRKQASGFSNKSQPMNQKDLLDWNLSGLSFKKICAF